MNSPPIIIPIRPKEGLQQMNMPIVSRSRELLVSDIRAVKDFVKSHGGLKKVEEQVLAIKELIDLPDGHDQRQHVEILRANVSLLKGFLDYAKSHGGLDRLIAKLNLVTDLASQTGGSLDKAKQAIDFLKEI